MSLKTAIYLLLLLCACPLCCGQKTTRPKLALERPVSLNATDTLSVEKGDLTFTGYQKTLASRAESMFVTNNTAHTVVGIRMTLVYYDVLGNKLHTRQTTVKCLLPPGETRVIDLKAWDKQQAWYYKHSQEGKYKNGSPFDVRIKTDCIIVKK